MSQLCDAPLRWKKKKISDHWPLADHGTIVSAAELSAAVLQHGETLMPTILGFGCVDDWRMFNLLRWAALPLPVALGDGELLLSFLATIFNRDFHGSSGLRFERSVKVGISLGWHVQRTVEFDDVTQSIFLWNIWSHQRIFDILLIGSWLIFECQFPTLEAQVHQRRRLQLHAM